MKGCNHPRKETKHHNSPCRSITPNTPDTCKGCCFYYYIPKPKKSTIPKEQIPMKGC